LFACWSGLLFVLSIVVELLQIGTQCL